MIALLYSKLSDPQFMAMILVGIAAAATVFTVAMPLVEGDSLGRRMKAVALERDKIRARERERLSKCQQKVSLRQAPKAYMKHRASVARAVAGEPRHPHERGREEGRGAAAEADRADDPVLPAGAVRGHHDPGADPGLRLEVSLRPARPMCHVKPSSDRQHAI